MNDRAKLKEMGVAVALLAVTATAARSEILPIEKEKSNRARGKVETLDNSINKFNKRADSTEVVGISKTIVRYPKLGDRQSHWPLISNKIELKNPRLEVAAKVADDVTWANSELIIGLPQADIQERPTSGEELPLSPPISENQKLARSNFLLAINTNFEDKRQGEEANQNLTIENGGHEVREVEEIQQTNKIFRVNEIEHPFTTAEALYRQPQTRLANLSANIQLAQQVVRITNIKIESTSEGIAIVIETLAGEELQVNPSVEGNVLIADIPNAVLSLPDTEEFIVDRPISGIAEVRARPLGFNNVRVTIAGETSRPIGEVINTEAGLTLSIVPVIEEIEVVVSATRTEQELEDIPRSVTVITREQIETQTNANVTNNVGDILGRLVPGLGPPNLISRRTRNQNLRGRPALILIDGVVQNSNYNNQTELNAIDPSAIERIEVVRGPSALYGSGATGGIINIITREPTDQRLEQQFEVGVGSPVGDTAFPEDGINYNTRYSLSGNQDNFNLRVDASLNKNNRFYDAEGDIIPSEDLDGTRSLNLLTKAGINFSEDQRLELSYNLYNDRIFSELITDDIITTIPGLQKARALNVGELDYEEEPQQTNHNLSLVYRNDNLFGSQLETQLFFQKVDFRQRLQDFRNLLASAFPNITISPDTPVLRQGGIESRKLGGRLQINTPVSEFASILWGVDYTNERNETEELILDPVALDERQEVNIIERFNSVPKFELNSVGIFAQGQWDLSEQLLLSGGVRYENINASIEDWTGTPFLPSNFLNSLFGEPLPQFEGGTNSASDVVFNAGVVYKASPEISLFANFAQGFAIPSLIFLGDNAIGGTTIDVGTSGLLEPEKVNNYEIGMRGSWESMQFTLAAFYNHSDKGQNLTVGADGLTDLSRSPQRNYGVEATLDWQPSDIWRFGGAFTWNEGEGDTPGDDRGWLALSALEVQPIKVTLYLENETLPNWRNRLQMLNVSNRSRAFDEGVDNFNVTGYTTFDFISTLELGSSRFELGVENLLNRQYLPVASQERLGTTEIRRFAAPGRTISIRYLLTF